MPSLSMPRFTEMIAAGMRARGHTVEVWAPEARAWHLAPCASLKKWFGYIDQFILFPRWVKRRVAELPADTLFVFIDQALGPWVPLVADRPHVIHCHDFLAQRSARGDFPEHQTRATGRLYQRFIRRGYRQGKAFLSISQATQNDLHDFLGAVPSISEVVYNGYNGAFGRMDRAAAWEALSEDLRPKLEAGFILHVGGDQWYKNRLGVVLAYKHYVDTVAEPLPLVLVGPEPSTALRAAIDEVGPPGRVMLQCNIPFEQLRALYNLATFLFFPSLEEGFGWPIAEAMACGCPVLTTNKPPMTEVGGDAVAYLPRMPAEASELEGWAEYAVGEWKKLLALEPTQRELRMEAGFKQAKHFSADAVLERYESVYQSICQSEEARRTHQS